MLQFFVPDGLADCLSQSRVVGVRADDCAQIGLFGGEEAGAQLSIGGQANAVAACAERLADRINKADLANAIAERIAARGLGRIAGSDLYQWTIVSLDDLLDLAAGQDILFAPGLIRVEG